MSHSPQTGAPLLGFSAPYHDPTHPGQNQLDISFQQPNRGRVSLRSWELSNTLIREDFQEHAIDEVSGIIRLNTPQ